MIYDTRNDIMEESALHDEYESYRTKTSFPLPYEEWKAKEEKKATESGIILV